ncbi:MAG: hypothetical protein KF729_34120 [Sandaracinaceae bacterium]|nr:hypothetical protein [Sandaracinaceae bacterium]
MTRIVPWLALLALGCAEPERSVVTPEPPVADEAREDGEDARDVVVEAPIEAPIEAPTEAPSEAPTDAPADAAEPTSRDGLPLAWLACERAADCTYVARLCHACAPSPVPVSRAHRRDALQRFAPRPCPHGPPGHPCREPVVSCRERVCAVRAFPEGSGRRDDDPFPL